MSDPITGGCLCRAVRFSFAELPLATRTCWCRDCQYLSSGNGSVNAIFATGTFAVTGAVADYRSRAASGNAMRRSFCPRCGTPLFAHSDDRPDAMVVRAGALDDPEIARPQSVIWTGSAPSWACMDPNLPSSPGQPR